jgi:hypothetical protein
VSWERAWVALTCYALCALALLLFAIVRDRGVRNYNELCNLIGLVALWPITVALELALTVASRRERRRRMREIQDRVNAEDR